MVVTKLIIIIYSFIVTIQQHILRTNRSIGLKNGQPSIDITAHIVRGNFERGLPSTANTWCTLRLRAGTMISKVINCTVCRLHRNSYSPDRLGSWPDCVTATHTPHRGDRQNRMRYDTNDVGKLYYAYIAHHYTTVYYALIIC